MQLAEEVQRADAGALLASLAIDPVTEPARGRDSSLRVEGELSGHVDRVPGLREWDVDGVRGQRGRQGVAELRQPGEGIVGRVSHSDRRTP